MTDTTLPKSAPAPSESGDHSKRYLLYFILLMAAVNVTSYMDRSVFAVLAPLIKADLKISDTTWGAIAGMAFAIPYAAMSIPLAKLADSWSRRGVLASAVTVWSGMTALCGLGATLPHLILGRMGVGAGEAGCLPPAQGMIAGHFPPEKRAGALAIHSAGISIGSMVGLVVGGWIGHEFGWRVAFLCLAVPGLIVAPLVAFTVRQPPKPADGPVAIPKGSPNSIMELIRARPAYIHMVMVFGTGAFFVAAMHQWLPSFYVREYGYTVAKAGFSYGVANGLAAITGVLLGGIIANRLAVKGPMALLLFCLITDIITLGFNIMLLMSQTAMLSLSFNFLGAAMSMTGHGAMFALVQGLAPAHLRSRAASLLMMTSALLGMSGGPMLVGFLSDQYSGFAGVHSLRMALLTATVFSLWPILHYLLAARTIKNDVKETV